MYDKLADQIEEKSRGKLFTTYWFPTIIYAFDIKDFKNLNKKWINDILDWKKKDQTGVLKSNTGGWHSKTNMHIQDQYKNITDQVIKIAYELHNKMSLHQSVKPLINDMWANVSQYASYNRHHTHPGSHISFVYYLQCPEKCGRICFTDPRAQALAVELPFDPQFSRKEEFLNSVYFEPIPGRFLFFPSWLTHEVEANLSDLKKEKGYRISVSGNITFSVKK